MVTVYNLLRNTDSDILCRKDMQKNCNIFCIRKNRDTVHRNGGALPMKLLLSSILVIKSIENLQAFITSIGSIDKISVDILLE